MNEDPEDDTSTLAPDDRFAVEVARLIEGRPDPSQNVHPPGGGPLDVLAVIDGQEQLDRIVG